MMRTEIEWQERERQLLQADVELRVELRKAQRELDEFLEEKTVWSLRTFGAGVRTEGVCNHIEKELREIRQDPNDLTEWIDVIILATDGYARADGKASELLPRLKAKHAINLQRKWQTPVEGKAVEHVRE